MAYAFTQDVPADERLYREVRSRLGDEAPRGLLAHVVVKREGGVRYVDTWETKEDWERFRDAIVEPTVDAVLAARGIPHDHSLTTFEEIEVIDVWVGHPSPQ